MLSVEKVRNVLGDRKEEMVTTPFPENKSLTKNVDKGPGELEDMKEAMSTIRRKNLHKFRVSLKYLQDGLNLIMGFKKEIYKIKTPNCIKSLLYRLMQNQPRKLV